MRIKAIVQAGDSFFWGLTKKELIDIILSLREEYTKTQAQIEKLKGEIINLNPAMVFQACKKQTYIS